MFRSRRLVTQQRCVDSSLGADNSGRQIPGLREWLSNLRRLFDCCYDGRRLVSKVTESPLQRTCAQRHKASVHTSLQRSLQQKLVEMLRVTCSCTQQIRLQGDSQQRRNCNKIMPKFSINAANFLDFLMSIASRSMRSHFQASRMLKTYQCSLCLHACSRCPPHSVCVELHCTFAAIIQRIMQRQIGRAAARACRSWVHEQRLGASAAYAAATSSSMHEPAQHVPPLFRHAHLASEAMPLRQPAQTASAKPDTSAARSFASAA